MQNRVRDRWIMENENNPVCTQSVSLRNAEVGHYTEKADARNWPELRGCVKVEVDVLGSRP